MLEERMQDGNCKFLQYPGAREMGSLYPCVLPADCNRPDVSAKTCGKTVYGSDFDRLSLSQRHREGGSDARVCLLVSVYYVVHWTANQASSRISRARRRDRNGLLHDGLRKQCRRLGLSRKARTTSHLPVGARYQTFDRMQKSRR